MASCTGATELMPFDPDVQHVFGTAGQRSVEIALPMMWGGRGGKGCGVIFKNLPNQIFRASWDAVWNVANTVNAMCVRDRGKGGYYTAKDYERRDLALIGLADRGQPPSGESANIKALFFYPANSFTARLSALPWHYHPPSPPGLELKYSHSSGTPLNPIHAFDTAIKYLVLHDKIRWQYPSKEHSFAVPRTDVVIWNRNTDDPKGYKMGLTNSLGALALWGVAERMIEDGVAATKAEIFMNELPAGNLSIPSFPKTRSTTVSQAAASALMILIYNSEQHKCDYLIAVGDSDDSVLDLRAGDDRPLPLGLASHVVYSLYDLYTTAKTFEEMDFVFKHLGEELAEGSLMKLSPKTGEEGGGRGDIA
ncbi:MAG: hypothetical protein Q9221_003294 [Calogaya cf. arnoldii]